MWKSLTEPVVWQTSSGGQTISLCSAICVTTGCWRPHKKSIATHFVIVARNPLSARGLWSANRPSCPPSPRIARFTTVRGLQQRGNVLWKKVGNQTTLTAQETCSRKRTETWRARACRAPRATREKMFACVKCVRWSVVFTPPVAYKRTAIACKRNLCKLLPVADHSLIEEDDSEDGHTPKRFWGHCRWSCCPGLCRTWRPCRIVGLISNPASVTSRLNSRISYCIGIGWS